MNILTVCGFGIAAACAIAIIRKLRPELAELAGALSGMLILIYAAEAIAPFIELVKGIAEEQGVASYFTLIIKALAISFCCKLSSEICRDCGEGSLGAKIELAGKAGIVLISLPIIQQLFEIAKDMLK